MHLRQKFKKFVYGSVPGFAGRFPYFGTQVYFPPGSLAFEVACAQGIYEPDNTHLVRSLIAPASVMFDVGANIGLMAIPALYSCESLEVVSFEPSPTTLACLQRTVRDSRYAARWHIVEQGAAASPGVRTFFTADARNGMFDGFRNTGCGGPMREVRIPVTTVDDEWRARGRPNVSLLKIDVEGAELDVLRGCTECLEQQRPAILTEWAATNVRAYDYAAEDLFDFARQAGYQLYAVPHMVRSESRTMLGAQLLFCSNFLLLADR
jgi:FkbM family methyltransferase